MTFEGGEYQAACRIVQRHPHGPRRWRPGTRRYLKPRDTWPWPDHEVMLYVAALWWKDAKPAVQGQLRHLIGDRHRHPNIHFVVELLGRDLVPGNDLREDTVRALCRELTSDQPDQLRWTAMVDSLFRLDPELAADTLAHVVRFADRTMPQGRRLDAVDRIAEHDPVRGAQGLVDLANNLAGPPKKRLAIALLIGRRDHDVGAKAVRLLAHTSDMRDVRVQAAIHTGDTTLWRDMVASWRDLSDSGRLRVGARLLDEDPVSAVAALEQLAATAAEEDTPVRVADMIRSLAPDTALRIAIGTARSVDTEVSGAVRLDAIRLIGKIEPARETSELEHLSRDPTAGGEHQFTAAARVLDLGGPLTAMVGVGENDRVSRTYRVKAAKVVAGLDPTTGARLLIAIAKTATDREGLSLLKQAYEHDRGVGAEALAEVADRTAKPGPTRMEAVEVAAATLGRTRTIELYTKIATKTDDRTALAAARKVKEMDTVAGKRVMAELARRPGKSETFRLTAAKEAGTRATKVLKELVDNARLTTLRLDAAQALHAVDPAAGVEAYQKLVRKLRRDDLRVKAALALPHKHVVEALLTIVRDSGEKEGIRYDAGVAATKKAPDRGREAMRALAQRPGTTSRTRERIRRFLS